MQATVQTALETFGRTLSAVTEDGDPTGELASGASLGEGYADMARPIITRRLAQAGVRLANELNAAFAETPAPAATKRGAARAGAR